MKILVFACSIVFGCISIVGAEVPNEISYSGRITEKGFLVNANRSVKFRFYNAETNGIQIANEITKNLKVREGIISTVISPNVDWRIGDVWLEVEVGSNRLSPRQKMTAQTYALHSKTAEDLSKQAGQNINLTIGSSMIASVSPTAGVREFLNNTTYYMVPAGSIIMWSGSVASIPPDWSLCNGINGTPDLRGRFIVGAGGSYSPGSEGGTVSHTHVYSGGVSVGSLQAGADGNVGLTNGVLSHSQHNHSYSGTTGSSSNLPPYYALCYIMKK